MEQKLNLRLFFVGLLSVLLTAGLLIALLYQAFDQQVRRDIAVTATMIEEGYSLLERTEELGRFASDDLRITLIDPEGQVLYESHTNKDQMENHKERPEVIEAYANGVGEATRHSGTLGLDTYYYALRLEDGNVLRVAMEASSIYHLFAQALPAVGGVILVILLLSGLLSLFLTRRLVRPIVAMADHLEDIDEYLPYPELEPFALALKSHQRRVDEAQRMRQDFTANVSHELKTPLTSISGYAEMIANGMARDEDVRDFAQKIQTESGRLIALIGDIIKLSELDDESIHIEMEDLDLLALANETADILSFPAERMGISLSVSGEDCHIEGNRSLIGELIYNLCDNAIRYNRAGGSVEISVSRVDDRVALRVRDTGIGIPREHHERVFERFYRVDKSRSKATGGTGLGLAIVKHIAMQHHATLELISAEGKGTIVSVYFLQGTQPESIANDHV